jgi:hypothetical protein
MAGTTRKARAQQQNKNRPHENGARELKNVRERESKRTNVLQAPPEGMGESAISPEYKRHAESAPPIVAPLEQPHHRFYSGGLASAAT